MKNKIKNFKEFKRNDVFYMIDDKFHINKIVFLDYFDSTKYKAWFFVQFRPEDIFFIDYKEFNSLCWEEESEAIKIIIDNLKYKLNFYESRLQIIICEEIENMDKTSIEYIAKKLGFEYPYTKLNPNTSKSGRTIDMLLHVLVKISEGKKVCIILKDIKQMRMIYDILIDYCNELKIKNYIDKIKVISSDNGFIKKEIIGYDKKNIFIDHSCYEKRNEKCGLI